METNPVKKFCCCFYDSPLQQTTTTTIENQFSFFYSEIFVTL